MPFRPKTSRRANQYYVGHHAAKNPPAPTTALSLTLSRGVCRARQSHWKLIQIKGYSDYARRRAAKEVQSSSHPTRVAATAREIGNFSLEPWRRDVRLELPFCSSPDDVCGFFALVTENRGTLPQMRKSALQNPEGRLGDFGAR